MTRRLRVLILVATAAAAFLAAVNMGTAKPLGPSARQIPPECIANPASCIPGGTMGDGRPPGGGPPGGGTSTTFFDFADLEDCPAGMDPGSYMAANGEPCKIDIQPCPDGVEPQAYFEENNMPCRPAFEGSDGEEMGGFDAPPTDRIQREMGNKKKYMVIRINVEGSGDAEGSFFATFKKVVSGVSRQTKNYLNEQLEGESFEFDTNRRTRCFADVKSDADRQPDRVDCAELADAADNSAGSISALFRGKVAFDEASYTPVFTARKIIFKKGSFNIDESD